MVSAVCDHVQIKERRALLVVLVRRASVFVLKRMMFNTACALWYLDLLCWEFSCFSVANRVLTDCYILHAWVQILSPKRRKRF